MKKLSTAVIRLGLIVALFASTAEAQHDPASETAPAAEPAPAPTAVAEPAPAAPTEAAPEEPKAEEKPAEEPAAEPEKKDNPVLAKVLGHAIEILAGVLMILMGWLVRKGIVFVEKKTKVDIPAKYEEMLAGWAGKSVSYASEKGHQFLKEKGEKMAGPDKLEAALGFGLSLAEEHGVTTLGKEKLVKYIESKLGETRAE